MHGDFGTGIIGRAGPSKPRASLDDMALPDKPELFIADIEIVWDDGQDWQQRQEAKSVKSLTRRQNSRRHVEREKQQELLKEFLKEFHFSNVSEPNVTCSKCSCLSLLTPEVVYPIHEAARLGDASLMRLLLLANVDPEQRTSKGRSAADIARAEDKSGSHTEVLDMLLNGLKVLHLREAMTVMMQASCRPASR
ncbi:ndor1 [Symbiodinium necroappetens]|uniref:Ndor1 protein n=1 Tax=Symbiodinium necroappetens TaxID=1628268 RepID=A0A812TU23_9DINO|nr:ndor1 [Symbiodinium necroappetens]